MPLAFRHALVREILDGFVEQSVEIKLGVQVQEHAAKPDGGPVHEHEFAWNPHRSLLLERPVNLEGLVAAVLV